MEYDEYDVVVVGSCMIDLICYAPRLPVNGETLVGSKLSIGFGGKGCNQCVAAKKLKGKCLLVARVGDDIFGKNYIERLVGFGIPVQFVNTTDGESTGMAQITVSDAGENHIVIVPGANERLSEENLLAASKEIANCKVLICQMEIPEAITIKALEMKSKAKTGVSILNAAPAKKNMNPLLYSLPDVFCVNEVEAEILTGVPVKEPRDADVAVTGLLKKGCKKVLITLGSFGCVFGQAGESKCIQVPALPVNAVDTTGAGDAFVGAFALYLAKQPDLKVLELLEKATRVASMSVMKLGTQDSFPDSRDLE